MIKFFRPSNVTWTKQYSKFSFTVKARFPGKVQGVVVQLATKQGPFICFEKISSKSSFFIGKAKSMDRDVLSLYSTSASARADAQSTHQ